MSNIFLRLVWGQTAKFKDRQYFWLYTVFSVLAALEKGLITFTLFHVPCHMTHQGGGAARCRVKAAVCHTPYRHEVALLHKVFVTF